MGEEEGRKPAAQHPVVEIRTTEGGQIADDHGREEHVGLAAGQGVFEAGGCAERRGAGGENARVGKVVGRDLQDFGRVRKAVDLVENDPCSAIVPQKALGVFHPTPHPGSSQSKYRMRSRD